MQIRPIFIAAGGASPDQLPCASVGVAPVVTADPDLRIFSVLSQSRVIRHSGQQTLHWSLSSDHQ